MNRRLFSPPARPARTPEQTARDWRAAVAMAGSLAKTAADPLSPHAPSFRQELTRLTVGLRDLRVDQFPVRGEAAAILAGPFLNLARSFVDPRLGPEARTACAVFLLGGARALSDILEGRA